MTCTPYRSERFDESAVRVFPTCASPVICTGHVAGPGTIVAGITDRSRPPAVHTAPVAAQDHVGLSETITESSEAGSTSTSHRSRRWPTGSARVTSPPHTSTLWSRNSSSSVAISSLNAILKLNAVAPSCCDGRPWKLAVRMGPATVAVGLL